MHGLSRKRRGAFSSALAVALCCLLPGCTPAGGAASETGRGGGRETGGQTAARPMAARAAPVVMVVGDSFTVGSGPVERWESYAARSARELGWQLITAGMGGTGFVNPGRVGRTFQDSFVRELAWRPAPDLLIISGGHNDRRTRPEEVYQAAARC